MLAPGHGWAPSRFTSVRQKSAVHHEHRRGSLNNTRPFPYKQEHGSVGREVAGDRAKLQRSHEFFACNSGKG